MPRPVMAGKARRGIETPRVLGGVCPGVRVTRASQRLPVQPPSCHMTWSEVYIAVPFGVPAWRNWQTR
jgi:hypothetical protein